MLILSQDRDMIIKYENVEAIGIENPLENDEGRFEIFCNTINDNQYTIGKYEAEERAKEVLKQIIGKYMQYYENRNKEIITLPKIYEMPEE